MKDYYKILMISHSANTLEIRKAYRKRALDLHPDINQAASAKEEFILINEAYEVLKNALSRARYDKLYNYELLRKAPKNEGVYQRRNNTGTRTTSRRAAEGRQHGEEYSAVDNSKFNKKQRHHGIWDFFSLFGDVIFFVLSLFG